MKKINHDQNIEAKGRKISAIIHIVILGLLAFPFLQSDAEAEPEDVLIVMDFSSGSSAEGARSDQKAALTPKAIETTTPIAAKPVMTTEAEAVESVKVKEETPDQDVSETIPSEEAPTDQLDESEPTPDTGMGAGAKGSGDATEGSSAGGNGRGYIEGDGILTRAVIDRGNTRQLAQQNGTLVLKICINRRGIVTFAEWDKDASSIQDSDVARTALDNVLQYRFENNRNAPSKECGRLTYIIDVD